MMRHQALIAVIVFSFLFAVYVTVQRVLLTGGMHPVYLNTLTYVIAATFLWGYSLIWDRSAYRITSKKGIVLGVLVAFLTSVVADMLVLYGLQSGTAITWSILVGIVPLVTYVLAVVVFGERFTSRKLSAIFLSIIGATLVLYIPGTGIDLTHGALNFLAAVVVFGFANVLNQHILTHITARQLTLLRLSTAAIFMCVLLLIFRPVLTPVHWLLVATNSIVLIAAIQLVNFIMHKTSASFFSIGSNIAPLFVVLLSIIFVGEWPTLMQLGGGIIIVGSIFLFQYSKKLFKPAA